MPTNEAEVPPERLYLIKSPWGLLPTYEKPLLSKYIEYVPAGALAEAWKRAVAVVVGLPVEHYIYSGAHNMDARTFRDNAVKSLEAAMQVEAARDAALSAGKENEGG